MKRRTAFVTGSSRGIGRAIALKLASAGANVVIAAKTTDPHPKLEGTIFSVAEEVEKAGGKALPVQLDIRDEANVESAIAQTVKHFGSLDILVNNASAINLSDTPSIPMKRYDLINNINTRGTFMVSKYAIPFLKKGNNPHILNLSPPLNLKPEWFGAHLAYTMSKYNMSLIALGLSNELKPHSIAVNALWPKTVIATAAIKYALGGDEMMKHGRVPEIMADAAFEIFNSPSADCTGNFFIDEHLLRTKGYTDFDRYAVDLSKELQPDLFV